MADSTVPAAPSRQTDQDSLDRMPALEVNDNMLKTMERKSLLGDVDHVDVVGGKMEGKTSWLEPLLVRRNVHTEATIDELYADQSKPQTVWDLIRNSCRVSPGCIGKRALSYVPFVNFLRNYQWKSWLVADAVAGLSAGFIHLPQGLGFGILASLSPVYGLYTSFFPVLIYLFFGSSPHVSMGTNAVIALLTASLVTREADAYRATLGGNATWTKAEELQFKVGLSTASCFVGGLILLGMGLLRFGFITNFLSKSFIGGFTFSAAVHITISQVVKLLNMNIRAYSGLGKLVKTVVDLFRKITTTNPADLIIGLISMAILLAVKLGINERFKHKLKIPVPIELIVVILSTTISHFAKLNEKFGIAVVGHVPTGLPAPTLPDMESLSRVAADAFVTAILIFALTISLAKLTAKLNDITIDDNQELVAYGICLVVGGFFQNFPSCTAPPRTMILNSLGSKTTFNGVTSALFILLVLLVAGQLFVSLPIAMLSAMIIIAMKDLLLQVRNLKALWKVNKPDFFIWVVTAIVSVLGDLDIGLLVGVVFSMITVMAVGQLSKGTLLGRASNEDLLLTLDRKGICPVPGVKIFRFESALYFASQERFKKQLYTLVLNPKSVPKAEDLVSIAPDPEDEIPTIPLTKEKIIWEYTESDDAQVPSSVDKESAPVGKPVVLKGGDNEAVQNKSAGHQMINHVILDCTAMTYIDVAGVDMLTSVVTQFERANIGMWLAAVPAGTLGTLQRAGFFDKVGKNKIFYSVQDALQRVQSSEVCSIRL